MKPLLLLVFMLSLALPVSADYATPGAGVTVRPARATWNTGYFQEALVRAGLEELGFRVKKPKELQNVLFYQALVLGDLDYWTNSWLPMQYTQMPDTFSDRATLVGYVMKAGGLQGYLASKKEVEKFNITSLEDFRRPEVRKAFDANGDGKADLVGGETGWAVLNVMRHHLKVYGLEDHINIITAGYTASIADALARYKSGRPVLFYTWAPNWTIFKMKPGTDVMWINVPEIRPVEAQKNAVERMTAENVVGAVSNPIKLGFIAADIRIAANKKFLAENPAAKRFFEVFTLPLADVNEQNTRMQDGEKAQKHIEKHAREWIEKNRATWDGWLEAARKAAAAGHPD